MKKINLLLLVLASCLSLSLPAQAVIMDKIVAVVNDEIITLFELNDSLAPIKKKVEESYRGNDKEKILADARDTILNRLIYNSLIEQEAKKSKILVKDEEVEEAINNIVVQRNIKKDDLPKILENEGGSIQGLKKDIKRQISRMRLLSREINAKVVASDEEIGEYYRKNRDFFEGKEAVRIKQILLPFPPDSDPVLKAKLKADAEMIHKQLKSGASFDEFVFKYSRGPAAATGGDVGFIEKGLMLPAVESVAFNLALEDISDVIESPLGFHIIKVIDKRGAGIKSIESVRDEIKEKIEAEKAEKRFEAWIQELRNKSHIEIKI